MQAAWNRHWGAPFGYPHRDRLDRLQGLSPQQVCRLAGPFAFQANNTTRYIEYPWVYEQVATGRRLAVIDVGGGLCGLQFVLARRGHRVFCVDPGLADGAGYQWGSRAVSHRELNVAFGTSVEPVPTTLEEAAFSPGTIDCITCVSTIEHIPEPSALSLMCRVAELLRPGGRFVATVDLFLDLKPFTAALENEWGTNIEIAALLDAAPDLHLVVGERDQLNGFPEFDHTAIASRLDRYCVGAYPCLAQCFVLEKRSGAGRLSL